MKLFAASLVLASCASGLCAPSVASARDAGVIHLGSTPATVHRGMLSPSLTPVLTIKSGQTVEIDTLSHSGLQPDPVKFFAAGGIPANKVLPDAVAVAQMPEPTIAPGQLAPYGLSVHVLTGPIYIEGAEPGDLLEVRILKVTPRVYYGVNSVVNGGAAPGMVPEPPVQRIIQYDVAKRTVNFAPGIHFPMRPFMGIMAVAPTQDVSSRAPGQFGGNMDFERLRAGSTLYLPVLVKGALFVTGDPHASQGDGEVSGNALESSMTPTLQFIVHKGEGKELTMPYAEDAANYYVLGMDPDLKKALSNAIRETVKFLGRQYGLSPADAYSLCSTAIDFSIAEAVDSNLTVYGTVPKAYFAKKAAYWAHRP